MVGPFEWIHAQWIKLYTKHCDGSCGEQSVHDGHLTRLGVWRYLKS